MWRSDVIVRLAGGHDVSLPKCCSLAIGNGEYSFTTKHTGRYKSVKE